MRICLLLACMALSALSVAGPNRHFGNGPLRVSSSGHYLEHENGTPFIYLGDTAWELFARLNYREACTYLEDRAAKGFNAVQCAILTELEDGLSPVAAGMTQLKQEQPPELSSAYLAFIDSVVTKAAEEGLYIALLPTWGDRVDPQWGSNKQLFNADNAFDYGQSLGRHFARHENIIWIMGGDRSGDGANHDIWQRMAEGIKSADSNHLMTYHPHGEHSSAMWFHNADWLDFNMIQTGHCQHSYDIYRRLLLPATSLSPTKPVMDGEPRYEDIVWDFKSGAPRFDDHDVRKTLYQSMLSGACGYTYGNNNIWQMYDNSRKPMCSANSTWHDALDAKGASAISHFRNLCQQIDIPKGHPMPGSIQPADRYDDDEAIMFGNDTYLLCYFPGGEKWQLMLPPSWNGSYQTTWMNPQNGKPLPPVTRKGRQLKVTLPHTEGQPDWLLIIKRNAKKETYMRLRCENMKNPLGVDVCHPRLSWELPSDNDIVEVFMSEDSLAAATVSPQCRIARLKKATIRVELSIPLKSSTTYFWRVRIGKHLSEVSSFTTAIPLTGSEWITDCHDTDYLPAPVFKRDITIDKPIKKALWVIASAGLHETDINGTKVGDHYLDPMFTRFDKRVLSVTHDVTPMLHKGTNTLTVVLGNGWYNMQSKAVWEFDRASWRNRPRFTAKLLICYKDGTTDTVTTDSQWKTADSEITRNSIYTAEHIDARKRNNAEDWKPATVTTAPTTKIKSQLLPPIRCSETYEANMFKQLDDSTYLYEFPQNIAGITRLTVKGQRGTIVKVKHGELIDSTGHVSTANIDYHYRPEDNDDPFATDTYILSGNNDTLEPKFNYKGFRYAEITAPQTVHPDVKSLTALKLHSDVEEAGYWHSSSSLLNKIWKSTNNSYLANLFGYPTDCPQREKNGWEEDATVALETGIYNYDIAAVFEKWMADFRDEQKPDGRIPCIIPTDKWGYDWAAGVDWTSGMILIPWQLYLYYGDTTILKQMYEPMKKYADRITTITNGYLTDDGLGDWIPVKSRSDVKLTTSICYYAEIEALGNIADILQQKADTRRYKTLARKIKRAINDTFYNPTDGTYANGCQTELAMPLYYGIVEESERAKVARRLHESVAGNGYHLDVGVLGCKTILDALSCNGYTETAYRLATQTTFPSWGYWMENGATTLHENWNIDTTIDNTFNHIMFGEIGAWLYKGIAGIRIDTAEPAFRHTKVTPFFPKDMNSLTATHRTPYGILRISWQRGAEGIGYDISIPPGMRVTLSLPDKTITLKSGKRHFTLKDI